MISELNNGEYKISVELEGGSGKASIASPATLTVTDDKMQAEIEWSSSHYDYMEVDGAAYYPVNTEGNSLFIIDVPELDNDIDIKAETLAMSEPHLIEYTLRFDSSTAVPVNSDSHSALFIFCALITVTAVVSLVIIRRKRSHAKSEK